MTSADRGRKLTATPRSLTYLKRSSRWSPTTGLSPASTRTGPSTGQPCCGRANHCCASRPAAGALSPPAASRPSWRSSALQSIPRPARNAQALRNLVGRLVIARHGVCRGPGEVVVQHLPQRPARVQAGVLHRLVETGDRPPVHLLVRAIAAVDPHDRGLIPVGA